MTCRYYIASPDYLQAEALLGPEAALERVGSGSDGHRALLDTLALTPDLLLLDAALPGLDGLALLCRLQKETITPPRVLFLARTPESAAASEILRERADARLAWPGQADALLLQAGDAQLLLRRRPAGCTLGPSMIGLEASSVNKLYDRFSQSPDYKEAGVLRDTDFDARRLFQMYDPSGNVVEIYAYLRNVREEILMH